jgi:hypothetical protein
MYVERQLESKCGQPYVGMVSGEYFEVRLNTPYDVETGKFNLKLWQKQKDDSGKLKPWNPVACVDVVGARIGKRNGLHEVVESYFRDVFDRQRIEESNSSQLQSSSEPCLELQTSCSQ